jgi:TPM domain/TIR domain
MPRNPAGLILSREDIAAYYRASKHFPPAPARTTAMWYTRASAAIRRGSSMPKIIVSYRRSDSQAIAGRIFDRLSHRYGEDSVFMDIDNIPFGIDFRTHIKTALAQSDIVVAIIGPRWAGATADGPRRIDEESDPVRVEVESALRSGVPVLPVLVDGATMPSEKQLPEGLKDLAFINAAPVDIGRDFRQHMDRLVRSIDGILAARGKPATEPPRPAPATIEIKTAPLPTAVAPAASRSRAIFVAIPLALVALAAGVWFVISKGGDAAKSPPSQTTTPAPASDSAAVQYPSYKGRISDEIGLLHPDTIAALTQKLADLEAKSGTQIVIAVFRDMPEDIAKFGEELRSRWQVGGVQGNGALLLMYPVQGRLSLTLGNGARDKLDRGMVNLIVQGLHQRLQARDPAGAVTHAIDDFTEILTGDAQAWKVRMSSPPAQQPPVQPQTPPPTTYRILPNVSGGVQNLRTGPATKYPIVVAVPAGSTGITISGCQKSEDATRPWCAANWRSYSGWISSCCIVDEQTGAPPRLD